ncbi:MAG: DUF1640 domain-containing protein [Magnetococcales bacterium]|nr:DUF1640 domain-containing protein [Magnetococcales bacterium]
MLPHSTTLKFVRRLRDAGVDEKQAEALSEAIRDVQEGQLKELATKGDIQDIKRDIKELELRIAAEMAPLKWGLAITVGGIVTLVVKSFFSH